MKIFASKFQMEETIFYKEKALVSISFSGCHNWRNLPMTASVDLQFDYSRPAGCGHCRWSAARSSAAGGAGGMSPSRQDQLKMLQIFHLTYGYSFFTYF